MNLLSFKNLMKSLWSKHLFIYLSIRYVKPFYGNSSHKKKPDAAAGLFIKIRYLMLRLHIRVCNTNYATA